MKQVLDWFLPSFKSFKNVIEESNTTSISRERFIDFIKVIGLIMITFNTQFLLEFSNSSGEVLIINDSFINPTKTKYTWFTTGISLFFFSTGFTNKIAWYSNVGRDGSQWKFLTDRVNSLMGPVLVWIATITILLNVFSRILNFPLYLTSQDDGIVTITEFLMWPLWIVSIYLVVVIFSPFTIYLHKKNPYLTMALLVLLTVGIDTIDIPISFSYIKLFNYLIFWLTIHQAGYFFADGKIFKFKASFFVSTSLISYLFLFYTFNTTSEFMSVSGYRLIGMSNEDPPTVYYLISSTGLLAILLFFRKSFEELLKNKKTWITFNFLHANIYTIFLWHVSLFFFIHVFKLDIYMYPLLILFIVFLFGDYERKIFKLSTNYVQRVNPLQPWPSPIKAKLSYNNFFIAWISSILILLGLLQVTLGGVGLSGFFTLRDLYFLTGNTFEAFLKLITGIILLNTTIRRGDLKNRILLFAAIAQIASLGIRNYQYTVISVFELYFSITLSVIFISIVLQSRNSKSKVKVK